MRLISYFMHKLVNKILLAFLVCFAQANIVSAQDKINTIAFGSCLKQYNPVPILDTIVSAKPDIFIFAGDNIYADTIDKKVMKKKYKTLFKKEEFQNLKKNIPIYATWDDHDYGRNNAGANFSFKQQSQEIFLDFFEVPKDAPERKRDGVYSAKVFGEDSNRVQIILLDTRYFRGPPARGPKSEDCPKINYIPQEDPDISILGYRQWVWLEEQLLQPAQVRIIVSSIQVLPDEHCFEKWVNFPHQREKLFQLIRSTNANGVIFISGDRHLAEISLLAHSTVPYPLFEITSSGLNSAGRGKGESNKHRTTADNFREDNFGVISIDWEQKDPLIDLQIRDVLGKTVIKQSVQLSSLHKN